MRACVRNTNGLVQDFINEGNRYINTHTHTHTHTYIYIYREREREMRMYV